MVQRHETGTCKLHGLPFRLLQTFHFSASLSLFSLQCHSVVYARLFPGAYILLDCPGFIISCSLVAQQNSRHRSDISSNLHNVTRPVGTTSITSEMVYFSQVEESYLGIASIE